MHEIGQAVGRSGSAAANNTRNNAQNNTGHNAQNKTMLADMLDLPVDTRTPPANSVAQDLWDIVMQSLSVHLVFTDFNNPANTAQRNRFELSNPEIVTIIDFRIPRTDRRLWTIDLRTRSVLFHERVSHGNGRGRRVNGDQTRFVSNIRNSRESSVGAYVTAAASTQSEAGSPRAHRRRRIALKIRGLDATNSEAFDRDIIFHGAHYVSGHRAGNSWGCPATTEAVNRQLIPVISGGTFVYAYL